MENRALNPAALHVRIDDGREVADVDPGIHDEFVKHALEWFRVETESSVVVCLPEIGVTCGPRYPRHPCSTPPGA
jgi:hypothetical protein